MKEVKFTKIAPLGQRVGAGTYECFWNDKKHKNMAEALASMDYVVVDFVQDDEGIIYFEAYHCQDFDKPDKKIHYLLAIQHFPFSVDMLDDQAAEEMAYRILASKGG